MAKYIIRSARSGEEQSLLDEGYEPFGISAHDTSYTFLNTSTNRREVEHQTTDYIYLRKEALGALVSPE